VGYISNALELLPSHV
jgi:hypothetical protein